MEGNSFSLSGVCDDRGQHAADTAAAREPCTEKIHVVGKFSRPIDFISTRYPGNTTKGSLSRELSRAAGARLRELPSAAAQPLCCSKTHGTDVWAAFLHQRKSRCVWKATPSALAVSATTAGARLRELPSIRTIPEQANPSLSYQKNLLSLIYYLLSKKSFFSPSRPDSPPIFPPPPHRKKSELCLHTAAPHGILNAESGLGGGNK